MRLCMVSYSEDNDTRVLRYAYSVIRRGDTVDMICLSEKGEAFHTEKNGIHKYHIYRRRYDEKSPFSYLKGPVVFFLRSFYFCTLLHFRNRYDIIHFHNIPDFGVFCTLIPKWMGAKVILDIHDLVPEYYMQKFDVGPKNGVTRLLVWIEGLSCRYADHVITVTELWRKRLISRSIRDAKRCSVILNVPDPDIFKSVKAGARKGKSEFLLSYHGNLSDVAGTGTLIRALPMIRKQVPGVMLQMLGHPEKMPSLRRLARSLGIEDCIRFMKAVHIDHLPPLMREVDVGIDPKRDGVYSGETLSVKAMEYLALGIPLVVSGTPIAREYFDDSMVLFFKPDDEMELAQQVIRLYESDGLGKRLARKAGEFFTTHHWNRYRETYFGILGRLTGNERSFKSNTR
jgi:glycosyltransferase involved in cell wall biosynthesis